MRLLLWSSSNTWRGWQGLGQICKPTPVGCTGLKSVTPPMFWQQELIQIFSPLCRKCRVASTIASAAQPTLAGSSSPGSAYGIAGVSCCPQMWLPTRLGTTTIGARIAWTCCWWLPPRTSRWHPWFPRSSTRCSSDAQRVTLGSWAWGKSLTSGAHGSGVWRPRAPSSVHRAASLPSGSQGETLASLGTRRSTRTSSARWLAGGAKLRHTATRHSLHWLRRSCKARLLVVLRGNV